MISVQFTRARWEVLIALAGLGDIEYQTRVWIRQELPHEEYYDSFDQAVHTLYDDWSVLPKPEEAVGSVLVEGPEVGRLRELGQALDVLLAEHGNAPDETYVRDPRWPAVVELAQAALTAVVLAGPISFDQIQ